jgi:hypothetical protein
MAKVAGPIDLPTEAPEVDSNIFREQMKNI